MLVMEAKVCFKCYEGTIVQVYHRNLKGVVIILLFKEGLLETVYKKIIKNSKMKTKVKKN